MIIVSGFIDVNNQEAIPAIVEALKERNVEVHDIKDGKIVFLVEREIEDLTGVEGRIRKELDSLKDIDGINNVYLAYFGLDDEGE